MSGRDIQICANFILYQIPEDNLEQNVCIESTGGVNGMAFWMVWNLDGVNSVSSGGPVSPVVVGENVDWDVHSKQGRGVRFEQAWWGAEAWFTV